MFTEPRWLLALLALPVWALLEVWAARRRTRAVRRLVGERPRHALLEQSRPRERWVSAALRVAAFAALVVGAARPEWGREVVKRGATGSDIVLAIDVSASMDARDVPPSRLGEARREALAVIDRLGGSRVGVVAFAGDAVRLCPLTLDRSAARLVVESLSSGTLSTPGTDLGKGLKMALRAFPGGRREEQALVLWTDGEDLEAGARDAIDDLARAGVRVFAVGVGTRAGDVVPMLDAEGRATDVKRDAAGNVVRSQLDEPLLRTLARRTRGGYFSAHRPGGELPRLLSAIAGVGSAARGERLIERTKARFGLFAAIAALLLALERSRPRRRRARRAAGVPLHSERGAPAAAAAALLLLLLAALLLVPSPARAQSDWAKADRAFRAGRFAAAESLYARRLRRNAPPAVRLNRATARAFLGNADQAAAELGPLAGRGDRTGLEAGFNLGTLLGQAGRYEPALESLRRVLERDPGDEDARWNYELLARRQKEEERKRDPRPDPQNPQSGGGGGGGGTPEQQQQQQQQSQQRPPQPAGGGNPPPAAGGPPPPGSGQMSRAEADQILDALQELARSEQRRQRRVRSTREREGRDW